MMDYGAMNGSEPMFKSWNGWLDRRILTLSDMQIQNPLSPHHRYLSKICLQLLYLCELYGFSQDAGAR